jgi:hypothetical protein
VYKLLVGLNKLLPARGRVNSALGAEDKVEIVKQQKGDFVKLILCFVIFSVVTWLSYSSPIYLKQEDQNKPVTLSVENFQILADGEPIIKMNATCGSNLLSFSSPKHGRFIISTKPEEGFNFQKIGRLEGNTISFFFNNIRYEWISSSPISSDDRVRDLWIYHDSLSKSEAEEIGEGGNVGCAVDMQSFAKKRN